MPEYRVGIMGGTFDPIHNAHLLMAEDARMHFDLDEVIFVPNNVSPFPKQHTVTAPKHRVAMVKLAVESNRFFTWSPMEIERDPPSYALDTVNTLRNQRPEIDRLFFITGADSVLAIREWHRYEDLLSTCEFIAAARPGFDLTQLTAIVPAQFADRVHMLPFPFLEISATDIRARVKERRALRYLMPDTVVEYIGAHGLYAE